MTRHLILSTLIVAQLTSGVTGLPALIVPAIRDAPLSTFTVAVPVPNPMSMNPQVPTAPLEKVTVAAPSPPQ